MQARWTTHRVIRRQARGTNTAADLHAAVAANLGEGGTAYAHVSSSHRVVQKVWAHDPSSESHQSTARGGASGADAGSSSQVGNPHGKEGTDHE
jgi:hypothetical protein